MDNGIIKVFLSTILILMYLLFGYFFYQENKFLAIIFHALIQFPIMICFIIYLLDKKREKEEPNDNFGGGPNLFFRYGRKIFSSSIPIGADETSLINDASKIEKELTEYLSSIFKKEYQNIENYQQRKLRVKDLSFSDIDDIRDFIQIKISTLRNSTINYFINFDSIGNQVVINKFVYLKGYHEWHDALWFIITSPIHLWFWVMDWTKGIYSVKCRLDADFNDSSFETMNIQTTFQSLIFISFTHIKKFAREKGLLTELLDHAIVNNINNSQNINIKGSNSFSLGNISSTVN